MLAVNDLERVTIPGLRPANYVGHISVIDWRSCRWDRHSFQHYDAGAVVIV
jgi:hypothetical protein